VERRGEGLSKHGGGAAAEKSTGDGGSKEGEVHGRLVILLYSA